MVSVRRPFMRSVRAWQNVDLPDAEPPPVSMSMGFVLFICVTVLLLFVCWFSDVHPSSYSADNSRRYTADGA